METGFLPLGPGLRILHFCFSKGNTTICWFKNFGRRGFLAGDDLSEGIPASEWNIGAEDILDGGDFGAGL